MLKSIRAMVAVVLALGFASLAQAQLDTKKLFFGAGLSSNSASGADNGTGFQFFGGYNFGQVAPQIQADVEVGYMDTGDMKPKGCTQILGFGCPEASAKGLWATGVGRFLVGPNVELIGRLGLDFGDDDGPMFGIGAGYVLNRNMKLRGEYVIRDNINSLQFNFVYQM